MVLLLPDLAAVLILFGALMFIYLCVGIVKALFTTASGAVSWIPGVGGWLKSGIHDAEQKIVGEMTKWAEGLDASIGWSLHQMARLVDWMGAEIESHANLLFTIATLGLGPTFARAIHSAIDSLHTQVRGASSSATAALHRLELAERRLARSVAQGVYPRLKALERRTTTTIPRDIAALRARTKTIEGDLSNLWKAVRTRPAILVDTAFVGAIAIALSRLGLGNLRCPGFVKVLNRVGCGGFGLLDELLVASFVGFAAVDLCDFAAAAQAVAAAFEPELIALVDVEDALVGCRGASAPPDLGIPVLSLPPVTRRRALAA